MRTIVVAIVAMIFPVSDAVAEPFRLPKDKTMSSGGLVAPKHAANNCTAYGAGFVKVDGTDTCVKVGGAVSIGAGGSVGRR